MDIMTALQLQVQNLGINMPANQFSGTLTLPAGWVNTRVAELALRGTTGGALLDAGSLSNNGRNWGDWVDMTNGVTTSVLWDFGVDGVNKPVYTPGFETPTGRFPQLSLEP